MSAEASPRGLSSSPAGPGKQKTRARGSGAGARGWFSAGGRFKRPASTDALALVKTTKDAPSPLLLHGRHQPPYKSEETGSIAMTEGALPASLCSFAPGAGVGDKKHDRDCGSSGDGITHRTWQTVRGTAKCPPQDHQQGGTDFPVQTELQRIAARQRERQLEFQQRQGATSSSDDADFSDEVCSKRELRTKVAGRPSLRRRAHPLTRGSHGDHTSLLDQIRRAARESTESADSCNDAGESAGATKKRGSTRRPREATTKKATPTLRRSIARASEQPVVVSGLRQSSAVAASGVRVHDASGWTTDKERGGPATVASMGCSFTDDSDTEATRSSSHPRVDNGSRARKHVQQKPARGAWVGK